MAYYNGHSVYQTDCVNFDWKYVNYDKTVCYDSLYSGGNRLYAPYCGIMDAISMMWRPVGEPCSGCPYYEAGIEKGSVPPGGYKV